MKSYGFIAFLIVAAALFGAWTQNSDIIHLRGRVYTGTSQVQLTDATGNLSTTSGTFSGAAVFGGDVSYTDIAATVTADVGSAQGSGVTSTTLTRVSTAAVAGDAVTLPAAVAGLTYVVCNHAAANAIDVFPASGDQLNNVTANNAISLAAGECMQCWAFNATNWGCVIGSAT